MAEKPIFSLPVGAGQVATKQGLDKELNRVADALWDRIDAKVGAVIANGGIVGKWDASTGLLPAARPDGSPINRGDTWLVTVSGEAGGENFQAADYLQALKDNPRPDFEGDWQRAAVGAQMKAADRAEAAADRAALFPLVGANTFSDMADIPSVDWPVGSSALDRETGASYIRAPDSATDAHRTAPGGRKVYATPLPDRFWMDDFGLVPDCEADAAMNKAVIEKIRTFFGSIISHKTMSPRTQGVYYLPTETIISAPKLRLIGNGATLRQASGSHTTNWLIETMSDDFVMEDWLIDGNRNGAPNMHPDSALLLVHSITKSRHRKLKVFGSSGKGAAVSSGVSGSGTRDIHFVECEGWDCKAQVFTTDRSNGGVGDAIPCEDIIYDKIIVGKTDHAGIAVNDGSRRVKVLNSTFDVQNSTWDAVSVRGARDVQIANNTGRRGRNGLSISVLDAAAIGRGEVAENITSTGNIWEENQQSGFQVIGGVDVSSVGDTARNNNQGGVGSPGFNVSQVSGVRRSNRVRLVSPKGYDNQSVPTQEHGIMVRASDDVRVSDPVLYGNVTSNKVNYDSGVTDIEVTGDGADGATKKRVAVAIASLAASGNATITFTFATPFAVVPNNIQVSIQCSTSGVGIQLDHVNAVTVAGVTARIVNPSTLALSGAAYLVAERT